MATHDGTEPRIVLGGRDHCLGIFTAGEDGPSLAIWQRIDRLGDTLGQGKVLEIVLHLIDRQWLGREDRVVGWHRMFVVELVFAAARAVDLFVSIRTPA